jgi:hypothetical protein
LPSSNGTASSSCPCLVTTRSSLCWFLEVKP